MIDFYNAFISYKHGPLDSKIAAHVQRKLEHFHVPYKLRKKIKHKKITRIFRDKDELPITSDLTETITDALAKAEYLIVLCSTHTKESFWVKREIATFLKTHSQDKILTVLCDGEPTEVIPEELLSQEKEFVDENGVLRRIKVPKEPLSCDYRLKRSTADKEELPRLASALLGCSYDELQRRRRQYRIRRAALIIGAAFAAMAAFGCYMGYTSKKINDTYIESLRTRSLYLSNESEQLLKEGRRVDSLQLALAALPSGENDKMPVTASAVRAITQTTFAYRSKYGTNYTPVWNFKAEHAIKFTKNSDDKRYIAAMDQTGNVYCWDTISGKKLFEKESEDDPVDIVFMDDDSLLITHKFNIEAYNFKAGKLMWKYDTGDNTIFKGDVIYLSHCVYFDSGDNTVLKLSSKDGSIKDEYKISLSNIVASISKLAVSPDGKKLAFADSSIILANDYLIHIFDTETGKLYDGFVDTYMIESISFADDGHLIVVGNPDLTDSAMALNNGVTLLKTGIMNVCCFDSKMNELWSKQLEYSDVATAAGSFCIPSRNAAVVYAGNAATVYDLNTGNELNVYLMSSSIIVADDFNSNGSPEFLCSHGEYILALNETTNALAQFSSLCDNLNSGMIYDDLYAVEYGGTDIIRYGRMVQDDEWQEISAPGGFITGSSLQTFYRDGDNLIIAAKVHETEDVRISIIDMNEAKLTYTTDVHDTQNLLSHFGIERVGDDIYAYLGNEIYIIDPENESVKKTKTQLDYKDTLSNGKIINCSISQSELTVNVRGVDGSDPVELTESGIGDFSWTDMNDPVYIKEIDKIFIPIEKHIFVADLSSSKIKEVKLPGNWSSNNNYNLYVTASEDGSQVLFSDGNTILVTDKSLKEQYHFHCSCYSRCSACFSNGTLIVIADNYLMLYDAKTGELQDKFEMALSGRGTSELRFDGEAHQVYIQTGDQINIFDTDTWVEIANIENAYCYHEETDRFFVYSYEIDYECTPGYIRHYTLDELKAKADRLLDGQELPAEVRSKYGL